MFGALKSRPSVIYAFLITGLGMSISTFLSQAE
ncbi:hypothetical protein DFR28_102167 [Arenicella xantha]|uniref:Uncharacterized protein n=1 Tax=Arenicella xantha TaxID=644221 RepID=A0A395JK12_9GAMM|nr:hypothetical protein DFR28_102167 [Arenicella xantha]